MREEEVNTNCITHRFSSHREMLAEIGLSQSIKDII
jgi:hypothetical protein